MSAKKGPGERPLAMPWPGQWTKITRHIYPGVFVADVYLAGGPGGAAKQTLAKKTPGDNVSGKNAKRGRFLSPASGRGRDKLGFHRRAAFPYILQYYVVSAHVLPHSVICCHMLPTFPRESSLRGESRPFCDDPVSPDPVWKPMIAWQLGG